MCHFIFGFDLKIVSWLLYGVWFGGSRCEVLGFMVYDVSGFATLRLEVLASRTDCFTMVFHGRDILCVLTPKVPKSSFALNSVIKKTIFFIWFEQLIIHCICNV